LNSEKTGKIWKKGKLNSEKIWIIWKKPKLNSEQIFWKYRRKVNWISQFSSVFSKSDHYSTCLSSLISISSPYFLLYFPYLFTIQLGFLP
jgi:hypothetical protein